MEDSIVQSRCWWKESSGRWICAWRWHYIYWRRLRAFDQGGSRYSTPLLRLCALSRWHYRALWRRSSRTYITSAGNLVGSRSACHLARSKSTKRTYRRDTRGNGVRSRLIRHFNHESRWEWVNLCRYDRNCRRYQLWCCWFRILQGKKFPKWSAYVARRAFGSSWSQGTQILFHS